MKQETALLGLLAETPIHAGAGQSVGAIDLPIQREAHSDWPCIFGSGVKGAMRARSHDLGLDAADRVVIFGPETNAASEHAGALTVGDARLILLPVRSLTGHFKWATCPALLRRLRRDLRRLGVGAAQFEIPSVPENTALVQEHKNDDTTLFLEEFRLEVEKIDLSGVIDTLADLIPDAEARALLQRQLAVVEDDLFGYLARYAVPVAAHVRIDNEKKTVEGGALWYEESLPPETVLYVALTAWSARREAVEKSAAEVMGATVDGLFGTEPYLQVGGNETVGMGWCRVRVAGGRSS